MTAAKLPPEVFDKLVRPIKGTVDADAAALAANVVARVVEKSEVGLVDGARIWWPVDGLSRRLVEVLVG